MPPLDRRRRRRRRRITPSLLVALAVAVALAILIGGVLQVGRASGPYRSDINRSYAAQGSILVGQSNVTGAQLRSLMARMTSMSRSDLRQELDALTSDSTQTATAAADLSSPPTVGGFAGVLADRARGVAELRAALDGVLGLGGAGQAVLPSDRAVTEISGVGSLLMRADRTYAAVRHRFRTAPGAARLPRSRWVTDPATWAPGPVQTLVQELAGSTSLSPVQRVVIRPGTVHIVPAAVPPVRPGGPSVVLPTRSLRVGVVVANDGNVAAPAVTVAAAVAPQGAGAADSRSTQLSLAPGRSAAVTLPALTVTPGDTYTLAVSVNPPPGQSDRSQTSTTFSIRIAAPTPAPTTTTTTTPTTTTKPTPTTRSTG